MKGIKVWIPILMICTVSRVFSQEPPKTNIGAPQLSNHNVFVNLAVLPLTYSAFVLNYEKRISKKGNLFARGGLGRTFQDDGYNYFIVALTAISKPLLAGHFEFTLGFQNWPNPKVPVINVGYRYQKPRGPLVRIGLGTEGVVLGLGYSFGTKVK